MKKKPVYTVSMGQFKEFQGYKITAPDGELDTFYPVKINPAPSVGYCETIEISSQFFQYITLLQDIGNEVRFLK